MGIGYGEAFTAEAEGILRDGELHRGGGGAQVVICDDDNEGVHDQNSLLYRKHRHRHRKNRHRDKRWRWWRRRSIYSRISDVAVDSFHTVLLLLLLVRTGSEIPSSFCDSCVLSF